MTARKKQFRPMFLRDEELSAMLGTLGDAIDLRDPMAIKRRAARDYAVACILCIQGLRCNELRMLDIEDVRFDDKELIIRHAKGGKFRAIPLYEGVAVAIAGWLAFRPDPKPGHEAALFLSGERTRLATRTVRTDAKRWAKAAGISTDFHPHTGRHTAVVRLRHMGASLEAVRDFVGHSSIAITNRYDHLDARHLRDEISKGEPTFLSRAAK